MTKNSFICNKCNKDFYTKDNLIGHIRYCDIIKKYDEDYRKKLILKYKHKKNKLKHTKKKLKSLKSKLFKHKLRKITDEMQSTQNKTFVDSFNDIKRTMFLKKVSAILDGRKKSKRKKSKRKKSKRKKSKRKKSKLRKSKRKKYRK